MLTLVMLVGILLYVHSYTPLADSRREVVVAGVGRSGSFVLSLCGEAGVVWVLVYKWSEWLMWLCYHSGVSLPSLFLLCLSDSCIYISLMVLVWLHFL